VRVRADVFKLVTHHTRATALEYLDLGFKANVFSNSNCKCNVGINRNDSNYIRIFTKTRQCFKDEQFEMALLLEINKNCGKK
jgi:hypothetical protein